MKKISILAIILIGIQGLNAQINISHLPVVDRTNSNVFLDASVNFSSAAGATNNVGKGIVIPSVDLVNFEFISGFISPTESPSFYDGMMVYNNASGATLTSGNRSSVSTSVTPGFYYFSNPNGAINENVTGGLWKPIGNSSSTTTIKGLVDCVGTLTQTINEPSISASSSIYVSYEDTSGDIIYTSVKNRVVGTSFTVQFGAIPSTSAKINYIIVQ